MDNRSIELKSKLLYGEITLPSSDDGIVGSAGLAGVTGDASGVLLFDEGVERGRFLLEL